MASVNTRDVGQVSLWQEITLMAGNFSFKVNKAVMYVQHILQLLFSQLHTLAMVKTT